MTQSVSNELIFFLWFQLNIILITFGVEVFSNWSVKSLLFPLLDVLEVVFLMERCICNKSVFISKTKFLIIDVLSLESKICKFWFDWTIFINVGINASNSVFIRSIKIADGLPDLLLNFQVVFEVIDDGIVRCDGNLIVVFVEFRVNIFG